MEIISVISTLVNTEINNYKKKPILISKNPDRKIFHKISEKLDFLHQEINSKTENKRYLLSQLKKLPDRYASISNQINSSYNSGFKGSLKKVCSTGANLFSSHLCMNSADLIEKIATQKTQKLIDKLNDLLLPCNQTQEFEEISLE